VRRSETSKDTVHGGAQSSLNRKPQENQSWQAMDAGFMVTLFYLWIRERRERTIERDLFRQFYVPSFQLLHLTSSQLEGWRDH